VCLLHHNDLLSCILTPSPQKFVNQFLSFEICLLGLGGSIYGSDIVNIRRLLRIQVQDKINPFEFDSEVIPHPSVPKTLNAQQYTQVCSVITSYQLIDIMARVSGVPSNGLDIMARVSGVPSNGGRGRCEVENREPEVSARDHHILRFH